MPVPGNFHFPEPSPPHSPCPLWDRKLAAGVCVSCSLDEWVPLPPPLMDHLSWFSRHCVLAVELCGQTRPPARSRLLIFLLSLWLALAQSPPGTWRSQVPQCLWHMCPTRVATDQHTLSALRRQKLIILPSWRLEVQDQFLWAKINMSGVLHSLFCILEGWPLPESPELLAPQSLQTLQAAQRFL